MSIQDISFCLIFNEVSSLLYQEPIADIILSLSITGIHNSDGNRFDSRLHIIMGSNKVNLVFVKFTNILSSFLLEQVKNKKRLLSFTIIFFPFSTDMLCHFLHSCSCRLLKCNIVSLILLSSTYQSNVPHIVMPCI